MSLAARSLEMTDVLPPQQPPPSTSTHASSSSDEEEADDDLADLPATHTQPPPNFNRVRRTSVSAESITPTALGSNDYQKVVIPKTDDQRLRIETSIRNNFLFRSLDEEQHTDVVNAMVERKVASGEVGRKGTIGLDRTGVLQDHRTDGMRF